MDDIKEGSIDLADSTIDLSEIEDAYNEDLDDSTAREGSAPDTAADRAQTENNPGLNALPGLGGM
jgi:hypothetical protein